MTETAATARDWADAGEDLGDETVRESFRKAPSEPRFPVGFAMTAKGLIHEEPEGAKLVTGPFKVVAQTRDKNSQAWGILLEWEDDDREVHRLSIARSLLSGDGREVRQALLHGGLYISPFPKDRQALSQFLATVKIDRRARAVSRVGWQDGSFALPDRTIGSEDGDLVVYQGTAAIDHEFRSAGTLEGWQAGVASLATGNSRLVAAISAGFVGPLLAAVNAEGGGLHLRGPSSIGKSTALFAAASIWGAPSFVRQWRATSNGLEGIAEQSNDCLLILDELAQLDPKEAGSIAYMLANGTGKSRASQTGEARAARRWRMFFLSSGEISLAEHARSAGNGRRSAAGQEVRIIDIEADAGKGLGLFDTLHHFKSGDLFARAITGNAATHYGLAGPEFVARLAGKLDAAAKTIREGIERFAAANLPQGATGQVSRVCQRLGLIAMAGEIAIAAGILPWKKGDATTAAKDILAGWIEARGGAGAAEDQAMIEQVAEFISTHGNSRFQLIIKDDQAVSASAPMVVYNRAGFRRESDTGTEYLIPTATWRNEVCKGLSPKSVSKLLVDRGYLLPDANGKASRSETAPGMGKARFYVVTQAIFGGDDA